MKMRTARMLIVLGLTGIFAGCFGMFGARGPEYTATVVVRNDVDPPTVMTIVLRQDGNDRETLGSIEAGQERSLSYTSRNLQGSYQLIARQSSGAAMTSREFTLFDGARVHWQIRSNTLTVTQH
jgi:hypothetical protein